MSERRARTTGGLSEASRLGHVGRPAQALAVALQLIATATLPAELAAVLQQAAWHHAQLGEAEHGLGKVIHARQLWQELGEQDRIASSTSLYGWLLLEVGLTDEAYAEADAAVTLAEAHGSPLTLAHALNTKAASLLYSRQPQLARPLLHRAVELARTADAPSAQSLFLTDLAYAMAEFGDMARLKGATEEADHFYIAAIDTGHEAIVIADSCGDGWMLRLGLCNTAEFMGIVGRHEEARALLRRWHTAPGIPGQREIIHHLYTSGELDMRANDLAAARAACSEALRLAVSGSHADNQMNCLRRLAEIAERQRDFEMALHWFKRFHELYRCEEGETIKRRAEAAEVRFQSERFRAEATRLAQELLLDPLTGIPNRRAFEQKLREQAGADIAIAIVDIDRFKAINDGHSHMLGDRVLRAVAEHVASTAEPLVTAARLGGEEFVLLFTGAAAANALATCEVLRRRIAAAPWSDYADRLAVTASIGLAWGRAGIDDTGLMEAADRRLYAAKAAGRNRVIGEVSRPVPALYTPTGRTVSRGRA